MKRIDYKRIILTIVAAAGVLAIAAVAPNIFPALGVFADKKKKYNRYNYAYRKVEELARDGFLKVTLEKGKRYISLTDKGKKQLEHYQNRQTGKPKRWDGKWRVVIFDVWEKSRRKRDLLRYEIKEFGFIQLQRSVWIYPYNCAGFIELLKTDLGFGKNIRYMVVDKLDHDNALRKHFNLHV